MKKLSSLLACTLLLIAALPSFSQKIQWNHIPQKGYVYQITNKEAQKLLAVSRSKRITEKMLQDPIDTFDVEKGWINRPDKGHFILVKIAGNKIQCNYTCVFPYQVFLLKEYNALAIQVLDKEGNIREDAKVKLGRFNRIRIDTATNSYRIENSAFTGEYQIATVELNGFRSVFNIQKHEVPEWYNNNYDEDNGPDFYSYLITDKNKYKPGEKVRFKSFALSQFRSPIKKDLEIWLSAYPKEIKLGTITPHRPGSFAGDFVLVDSLKLTLDKSYYLQLRDKNKRVVSSCSFMYEDYELSGNKLELQLVKSRQFYPDTNTLIITATDENGLMLKDARAEIIVKTNTILESFEQLTMLPDTLMLVKKDLDPEKPTVLNISPTIFQKTNTSYSVIVSVRNSENQLMVNGREAIFYYSNYELVTRFEKDSICFDLLQNNIPLENIPVSKRVDDELSWHQVSFPYREKINPAIGIYHFENQLIRKDIALNQLYPLLEITGGIQQDSFNISLENPQKLEISWFIYQGGQLLHRASGTEMEYLSRISDRTQTYYVELLYSFGGQEHIKQRVFEFREDFLDVSLEIPDRVYPGQKIEATIAVKDQRGIPVRGVDLTAMAVTAKLNYYLPSLPYYGTSSSPRSMALHYSKTNLDRFQAEFKLDYSKWNKLSRLDTMMYYRFTYPSPSGFVYKMDIDDSSQFAPFVMKDGEAQQIYVIEVDHIPVYYSWTAEPSAYSFYVNSGRKHAVTLRLWDRVIILDSMKFEPGKKTLISVSLDHLPIGTKTSILENRFSQTEIRRISSLVSSVTYPSCQFSYLDNDLNNDFIPLFASSESRNYGNKVIGPLQEGKKTYVENCGLRTTYKHAGGFNYSFEDNIVYKTIANNLWPLLLTNITSYPMQHINDLRMTKSNFLEQQNPVKPKRKWHARTIDMVDSDGRLRIFLPEVKDAGIGAVIFRNTATKTIISPFFDKNTAYIQVHNTLPTGSQTIIVLYTDGRYLKMDSIIMKPNHHLVIDLNTATWQPADSLSEVWLSKYEWDPDRYYQKTAHERKPDRIYQFSSTATGNLTGSVYDETNNPLPGAVVMIKGTQSGAVTDINGHFVLQMDDYMATIMISYIGYMPEEFQVTRGSEIRIKLQPDIQALEEVVVIGYGTVMKSELSMSLQGKVSGISIVKEENLPSAPDDMPIETEKRVAEKQLYQELLTLKTIRSNFSDVGFWEPKLYTDNHGLSKFSITFPDDITRWDAVVYAMNRSLQTGTLRKSIRSYKPLMAELKVSGFLTQGDSANFLGKVLNYTQDTMIMGQTEWAGGLGFTKNIRFSNFHSDKLTVNVNSTDSLKMRYTFTRDDGYMDGEERVIPVVEQGIIRAEGTLSVLKNGDMINAKASAEEKFIVEIMDNQLDIYKTAANDLIHYRYLCNEQLASRLIGFINYKRLMQYEAKPFRYDRDIHHIIAKLLRNQNREFLWSWWDISNNTSYWMSAHILRALKCASDAGYEVDLNIDNLARKAEYKFEFLNAYSITDIDLLQSLAEWDAELNYKKYLTVFDSIVRFYDEKNRRDFGPEFSFLTEKFILQEIRQMKGLGYERDSILHYRQEGMLGDLHFSDGKPARLWWANELSANSVAYRIIRRDSLLREYLIPLQLYFMAARGNSEWNTYQSSNLLMSVLPDLLSEGATKATPATIKVNGKNNETITKFPYRIELMPGEEITVQKESGIPVYYMQYVKERVKEARTGVDGFKIKTWFTDNRNLLEAGKPVELIVDVEVEKKSAAENVMIEVPIPGSCSYADKRAVESMVETHREYFKEKTVIFCERMEPGKYTFKITLLPRFTGSYIVNPAQVSLMYFPVVNANTAMKKVEVSECFPSPAVR